MAEGDSKGDQQHPRQREQSGGAENHEANGTEEEPPQFSDPEDFEDDIEDEELLADLLAKKPKEIDGLENCIVVDRIPQVGPERVDKLKSVLRKLFSKFGEIVTEYYPVNEENLTLGYMFIEYDSKNKALEAVKNMNGYKLDKQHVFAVNLFTDIDKYLSIPDEFEPPQPEPYKDPGNLWSWLQDPDCYDQYVTLYDGGATGAIYQNSAPEPTLVAERQKWTDSLFVWSPQGTYLATFHAQGVILWGGEKMEPLKRLPHEKVSLIDFSPCEKYLVSFSPVYANSEEPMSIIVWDIRTRQKKRAFHADMSSTITWPVLKWSHDDRYFAKLGENMISVYETQSFGLLDKKSLKINGVKNFAWSPSQNIISYWVPEDKDVPARVVLVEIPSRNEPRAKNLFSVAECRMHWHKQGDYLCVKVDRYTKAKRDKTEVKYSGLYYNFEVFHMREKHIPVDSVELKESIVAFAWEPVGNKFAIIHGDGPQYSISFYGIKPGANVVLLKKFEQKQCNHLFWSPAGRFILLAGLRSSNDSLEWIDTADFTITNQDEHFMATDVEWDPTGRYVVTAVSWWAHKADNSYWLWSSQGRLIRKHSLDKFCQLLWRPRPPSLLSEDQIRDIRNNLKKKYSAQFDMKDKMAQSRVSKEILEKRQRLVKEFQEFRKVRLEEYEAMRDKRIELRGGKDPELEGQPSEFMEETIELIVKEEVEVLTAD